MQQNFGFDDPKRSGMRLDAIEVLNWGTFNKHVWSLDLGGENGLLTGDIGSGKSTLVDAITALLVPARKISFNKAAGAGARERDLRSYVLGYYKSQRSEGGLAARPVALRNHNALSVILGRFRNEQFDLEVTLAQVLWFREQQGQPSRLYIAAKGALTIKEHFTRFGQELKQLKKRLKKRDDTQVFDSFPPYGVAFRRLLGIKSEQALDLFHQTVSMKSVGDLTDFVRTHMLEPFHIEDRVRRMIAHFEDLDRAHEAVLKAKAQIEYLAPIIRNCDEHDRLSAQSAHLHACQGALGGFFADKKVMLLEKRIASYEEKRSRLLEKEKSAAALGDRQALERDAIKQDIARNGGDRLAGLGREIDSQKQVMGERRRRAEAYNGLARKLEFGETGSLESFLENARRVEREADMARQRRGDIDNELVELEVGLRKHKETHEALLAEIASLKKRRSNLPAHMLALREEICDALSISPDDLPFAGELLKVPREHRDWEGAAERLLHGFALSLLVSDDQYRRVSDWVNRTHLGRRLVYYRVRRNERAAPVRARPQTLAARLEIRSDTPFEDWLYREAHRRFDHVCCEDLEQFRREVKAITRTGQIKLKGGRHEKDDRRRIDDRTRYVLGWSNEKKIAALAREAQALERRMQPLGGRIATLQGQRSELEKRLSLLDRLGDYRDFEDVDWRSVAAFINDLTEQRRQIEEGSDQLGILQAQLEKLEREQAQTASRLREARDRISALNAKTEMAEGQLLAARELADAISPADRQALFPALESLQGEATDQRQPGVDNCDSLERQTRKWLEKQIAKLGSRIGKLTEKIVGAMRAYIDKWPQDALEADASIRAADEFRAMHKALRSDDLPRFQKRFKELLNENTIREVANFQARLRREKREISERLERINRSLKGIDYVEGRYIRLEANEAPDVEIRDFQQDLRACTENALSGSQDSGYSEEKFLQVRRIIERFRGREGKSELDRRWTAKVTDVRNWFVFSASERWREDDTEHEHYSDSGGKSGGQKEKLAYTILAASIAYQFGLEPDGAPSRAFHFVAIDEAFGRGSDESAKFGLELFKSLGLQLLIVTPLQKIHIIEPYVSCVGFVHNEGGARSVLRNMTIEEYQEEKMRHAG